jgi:hypothetical protein
MVLLVELLEDAAEEGGTLRLVMCGGVVVLALEGGGEFDGDSEVDTGFADRFEGAVQLGGPVAPAVAEHPLMFGAEPFHVGPFGVGGEPVGVEVFDLVGDGEVFVGDGAVGDAGVGHGHLEGFVAEEGGDGFEAHTPVDGLGGEGVAELVGVDVADSGLFGDSADHAGDPMPINLAGLVGEEDPMPADVFPVGLLVGGDVFDQVGVEGDVAVVSEFADWDFQPVTVADFDDRVGVEVA